MELTNDKLVQALVTGCPSIHTYKHEWKGTIGQNAARAISSMDQTLKAMKNTPLPCEFVSGIKELSEEIDRALTKHPEPKTLVAALIEEVGEALREPGFDESGEAGNREWLQVACVAMRLYVQGSGGIIYRDLADPIIELEKKARQIQGE